MLIDVNLKVKIQKNNKYYQNFCRNILKSQNGLTRFQNLSVDDFEPNNK